MIPETKTPYRTFNESYYSLPANAIKSVKHRMMTEMNWSISTFHYKRRGESPIKPDEVGKIEKLFAEYGIDAWTGKTL